MRTISSLISRRPWVTGTIATPAPSSSGAVAPSGADSHLCHPADAPRKCIDYVFMLKNKAKYKVTKTYVPVTFENGDVAIASDHCPVFVEMVY